MSPSVHTLTNGVLELTLLPGAGGRLLGLRRLDGPQLLFAAADYVDATLTQVRPRDTWPAPDGTQASWANLGGSKVWPAPQERWQGPPDPVLDSGEFSYEAEHRGAAAHITMTSQPDTRTGLQVTRTLVLADGSATLYLTNTFANVSDEPITWSAWEVCQCAVVPGTAVEVAVAGSADPVRLVGTAIGEVSLGSVQDGIRTIPVEPVVGKLGFPDATGRIALQRPGARLDIGFAPTPGDYPDGGCRAELWMQTPTAEPLTDVGGLHPREAYVELEVLSPLTTLQPGQELRQNLTFTVS